MLQVLTSASDKLVGLVAPRRAASAATCREIYSWCDPNCPFWWWKRVHRMNCTDGYNFNRYDFNRYDFNRYECCGCGC